MSHSDDLPSAMNLPDLSHCDAEALLAGRPARLAPPGYGAAADLLNRLTSVPTEQEASHSSPALTAALGALRDQGPTSSAPPTRIQSHRTSRMVRLAAAVSAGVTVLGGTAAAAATGSLPAPAQHAVASVLSDVGVSVPGHPSNSGSGSTLHGAAQTGGPSAPAAQANGKAELSGLCRAFLNPATNRASARFAVLIGGHGGTSAGATGFCHSLLATSARGSGSGGGNSGPQPGQEHGQSDVHQSGQNSANPTPGSSRVQPGTNGRHTGSPGAATTPGGSTTPTTTPRPARNHSRLDRPGS